MNISVGTFVVRRSYCGDIYFNVVDIRGDVAILKGVFQRLIADAPIDDLIPVSEEKKNQLLKIINYLKHD